MKNKLKTDIIKNMFEGKITCLGCKVPRCETGCPCKNHIRDIIALVKEGKEEEAAALLYSTNPFPEWTSLLCDHDRNCRGHCVLGIKGQPFDFPKLEVYLAASFPRPSDCVPSNGKRIAVIGAGPAGLAASYFLARAGYSVEVYEKENEIGGVLYKGIPSFRYPKDRLASIREELASMGIGFHLGIAIDFAKIDEFCNDFEKVFIASGAENERTLGYDQHDGVEGGLTLLYNLNILGKQSDYASVKQAFVWGGGNVAMDCARSLVRLGVKTSIIYRRGREQMPAAADEIEACVQDGVELRLLTNIKDVHVDENGRLTSVIRVQMELGEPDASGRASFHELLGTESEASVDLLIPALGETIDLPEGIGGHEKIILIGDCKYGAKNIASAIADARISVQEYLGA